MKNGKHKSAGDTAAPITPALVPQPHGGALFAGGVLGNKGGRPRDAVRALYLAGAAAAAPRLRRIAVAGKDEGNAIRAADVLAKHGLASDVEGDTAQRPILVMGDLNVTQVNGNGGHGG